MVAAGGVPAKPGVREAAALRSTRAAAEPGAQVEWAGAERRGSS